MSLPRFAQSQLVPAVENIRIIAGAEFSALLSPFVTPAGVSVDVTGYNDWLAQVFSRVGDLVSGPALGELNVSVHPNGDQIYLSAGNDVTSLLTTEGIHVEVWARDPLGTWQLMIRGPHSVAVLTYAGS